MIIGRIITGCDDISRKKLSRWQNLYTSYNYTRLIQAYLSSFGIPSCPYCHPFFPDGRAFTKNNLYRQPLKIPVWWGFGPRDNRQDRANGGEGSRTPIPAMRPRCAPITPRPHSRQSSHYSVKRINCNCFFVTVDASVKSTLPPRFWGVGIVFAAFFGLLTVASPFALFTGCFLPLAW